MFDVYLYEGGRTAPPDLDDLAEQIPALKEPDLRSRMEKWRPGGFLGLDLPETTARVLLDRLEQAKARGHIVPSDYRKPKITVEAAQPIAERAMAELHATRYPTCTLGTTHYLRESPWWWTFAADCKELQEAGYIPGALFASIDKLDGHIWQPEEIERLFEGQ